MLKILTSHLSFTRILLAVVLIVVGRENVNAQRVYATSSTPATTASGVTNPSNALSSNGSTPPSSSTPTVINASGLSVNSSISYYAQFSNPIAAYTTVMVKLSNVTAVSTTGAAYKNATTAATGTNVNIFTAADGFTYLAVSATEAFDRIRITTSAGFLGAATTASVHQIYYNTISTSDCGQSIITYTSGTLGGSVTNPNDAIDGNITTKSTLGLGILASTVQQAFYFSGPSASTDAVKLSVSIPPTLLDVSLLNSVQITFYNGGNNVYSNGLGSLLSLNLLTILGNGSLTTSTIAPGFAFDRVTINITSILNLFSGFNIHEIQRVPSIPTLAPPSSQNTTICVGSTATLTASAPGTGNEIRWYNASTGGTLLYTGNPFTPSPTSSTTYYMAKGKIGCSAESERVPVSVTVNPKPASPHVSIGSN